jgi:alcohol dehydrogenase, propanol-preferring
MRPAPDRRGTLVVVGIYPSRIWPLDYDADPFLKRQLCSVTANTRRCIGILAVGRAAVSRSGLAVRAADQALVGLAADHSTGAPALY